MSGQLKQRAAEISTQLLPQWDMGESFRVAVVRKAPMARSVDDAANAFLFAFARDLGRENPPAQ